MLFVTLIAACIVLEVAHGVVRWLLVRTLGLVRVDTVTTRLMASVGDTAAITLLKAINIGLLLAVALPWGTGGWPEAGSALTASGLALTLPLPMILLAFVAILLARRIFVETRLLLRHRG